MKSTYTILTLVCSVVLFAACKKSESDNRSTVQKILEAGKWQQTAGTATVNYMGSDTTIDAYAASDACEKDDILEFKDDGIFTKDEGANVCAGKPQIGAGMWALVDNDTRLAIIDANPDTMELEISDAQMTLTQVKPNSSGDPVTYVDVFKNIR